EAGGPHPDRLAAAALIPLDQIANPAVLFLVEAPLGGLPVARIFRALHRVGAAQDRRVQLEPVLEVPHREQVDALGGQRVDQGVARDHVADHAVVQRLTGRAQALVDARELTLDVAQRALDGREVEQTAGGVARRVAERVRRGYWIRSRAARDREATS